MQEDTSRMYTAITTVHPRRGPAQLTLADFHHRNILTEISMSIF